MSAQICNPLAYRVGFYIRLSKEDEKEGFSESVSNQLSLLQAFAKEQQLLVYDTYIDDGWSGTRFDRPAFQRLLADIEAKKVNMVITKDLSRLGRDYILTGHYMERYFPEKRVRYLSLLDGIDTGIESSANDITPFRAIMNDMYAKDISQKIKAVKRDKQRKGAFIGGKPMYGYKMHPTEKNKIVIDETVAPHVRRIFAMALAGKSCRQIATTLNSEQLPPPSVYCGWQIKRKGIYAGLWSSERIAEMLQNETYIGNMVQGRSTKISYKSSKSLKQPPENWVIVAGTHEAIIDTESFRRVQLLLQSRRHTRSRTYDFLLKGLIFCHECGYPLAVLNRKNTAGEDRLYFVCRTYQRFSKAGVCSCHTIRENVVTDAVLDTVRELCALEQIDLLPLAETALKERQFDSERKRQSLQSKIDSLTVKLDAMYLDKLSGLLAETDFERMYQRLQEERHRMEQQRNKIEQKSPILTEDRAFEWVERFWNHPPRELLVSLIERIELTADKQIRIYFRFPKPNSSPRLQ